MTPIIDPADANQSVVYLYCERGDGCPDYREGFEHAHGRRETRPRGADATPPLRSVRPTVPDVRA